MGGGVSPEDVRGQRGDLPVGAPPQPPGSRAWARFFTDLLNIERLELLESGEVDGLLRRHNALRGTPHLPVRDANGHRAANLEVSLRRLHSFLRTALLPHIDRDSANRWERGPLMFELFVQRKPTSEPSPLLRERIQTKQLSRGLYTPNHELLLDLPGLELDAQQGTPSHRPMAGCDDTPALAVCSFLAESPNPFPFARCWCGRVFAARTSRQRHCGKSCRNREQRAIIEKLPKNLKAAHDERNRARVRKLREEQRNGTWVPKRRRRLGREES